jgi:hypothetical protein
LWKQSGAEILDDQEVKKKIPSAKSASTETAPVAFKTRVVKNVIS